LEREKMRDKRRKQGGPFYVRMDHSKSHDGAKIQSQFDITGLVRFPHPHYSRDLSPYDFWFFGTTKEEMEDREFHKVQDIRSQLTEIWTRLTFEDVQSVFLEWKIRLNWVIEKVCEDYRECSQRNRDLHDAHFQSILSARLSGHPVNRLYVKHCCSMRRICTQDKSLSKNRVEG
jgi:hypothetical protein